MGEHIPLEQRETSLEGEDQKEFLLLVRKMLQWEPEKRQSAKELERDMDSKGTAQIAVPGREQLKRNVINFLSSIRWLCLRISDAISDDLIE